MNIRATISRGTKLEKKMTMGEAWGVELESYRTEVVVNVVN